jgi:hypothetical protein
MAGRTGRKSRANNHQHLPRPLLPSRKPGAGRKSRRLNDRRLYLRAQRNPRGDKPTRCSGSPLKF